MTAITGPCRGHFERNGDVSTATAYNACQSGDPYPIWLNMTLRILFAVLVVYGSLALGKDTPKVHARFFNDSAKAVNFYVDGHFGCSVPANPEENLAYCDKEIVIGKHRLSVEGPKLQHQSCDLFVVQGTHAEANLSKGERLHCSGVFGNGP